jgi:hypothetical protein
MCGPAGHQRVATPHGRDFQSPPPASPPKTAQQSFFREFDRRWCADPRTLRVARVRRQARGRLAPAPSGGQPLACLQRPHWPRAAVGAQPSLHRSACVTRAGLCRHGGWWARRQRRRAAAAAGRVFGGALVRAAGPNVLLMRRCALFAVRCGRLLSPAPANGRYRHAAGDHVQGGLIASGRCARCGSHGVVRRS